MKAKYKKSQIVNALRNRKNHTVADVLRQVGMAIGGTAYKRVYAVARELKRQKKCTGCVYKKH